MATKVIEFTPPYFLWGYVKDKVSAALVQYMNKLKIQIRAYKGKWRSNLTLVESLLKS